MDFYQDDGHLFAKIFHNFDLPKFAKEGSFTTSDSLQHLPFQAFAHPSSRSFPVQDRANTFISASYAYAQPEDGIAKEAIPMIEKMATLYAIQDAVAAIKKHIQGRFEKDGSQKNASGEIAGTWEIPFGANRSLSIKGADALNKAAGYFLLNFTSLPFEDRTKTAQAISDAAQEINLELPSDFAKFSGKTASFRDQFKLEIALRSRFALDSCKKQALLSLGDASLATPEDMMKVAGSVAEFDQEFELARFYGETLTDPHRAVFNLSPQEINQKNAVIEISRVAYPYGQWTGDARTSFREGVEAALGKEKAALLFTDDAPVQSKFAELTQEEQLLVNRYIS